MFKPRAMCKFIPGNVLLGHLLLVLLGESRRVLKEVGEQDINKLISLSGNISMIHSRSDFHWQWCLFKVLMK